MSPEERRVHLLGRGEREPGPRGGPGDWRDHSGRYQRWDRVPDQRGDVPRRAWPRVFGSSVGGGRRARHPPHQSKNAPCLRPSASPEPVRAGASTRSSAPALAALLAGHRCCPGLPLRSDLVPFASAHLRPSLLLAATAPQFEPWQPRLGRLWARCWRVSGWPARALVRRRVRSGPALRNRLGPGQLTAARIAPAVRRALVLGYVHVTALVACGPGRWPGVAWILALSTLNSLYRATPRSGSRPAAAPACLPHVFHGGQPRRRRASPSAGRLAERG